MPFTSNRRFGVEIEFALPRRGVTIDQIVRTIEEQADVACRYEDYNHTTRRHWKIVTDASCGYELVSPPLQGQSGLNEVGRVVQALNVHRVRVGRRCGLHVHVDAQGLTVDDFRNVLRRYGKYESVIDTFMPPSRRGDENEYCDSLVTDPSLLGPRLNRATTIRGLTSQFFERNLKVNVLAYEKHKTIEFRHHSGSTNPTKITNWIQFCVGFLENSIVSSSAARQQPTRRRGNKLYELAKALCDVRNHNGAYLHLTNAGTTAIRDEVGITRSTFVSYVSKLRQQYGWDISLPYGGVEATVYRVGAMPPNRGETTTENIHRPEEPITGTHNIQQMLNEVEEEDNWHKGLSEEIVQFYKQRALNLAAQNNR